MNRLLSLPQVCALTTLSPSTIYRMIKKNNFPSGRLLSSRRRGWQKSEIEEWLNQRDDDNESY